MKRLTEKEEMFCLRFIELGNASQAYRKAYDCTNKKPSTIHVRACEIQKRPKIQIRLEELRAENRKKYEMTVEKVVESFGKMATANVIDLHNEDGSYKNLNEIDARTAFAITSIDTQRIGKGDYARTVITKIRLSDKKGALENLARILGMYKDPVGGANGEKYESMLERLARIASEKVETGDNPGGEKEATAQNPAEADKGERP